MYLPSPTGGTTGEEGLYIRWNNNEIMYHVSTMLPFNPKDKQQVLCRRLPGRLCTVAHRVGCWRPQLERKRHIGNDIVILVWQDGETVYRPTTISSRQVHVAFVIKAVFVPDDPDQVYYRYARALVTGALEQEG